MALHALSLLKWTSKNRTLPPSFRFSPPCGGRRWVDSESRVPVGGIGDVSCRTRADWETGQRAAGFAAVKPSIKRGCVTERAVRELGDARRGLRPKRVRRTSSLAYSWLRVPRTTRLLGWQHCRGWRRRGNYARMPVSVPLRLRLWKNAILFLLSFREIKSVSMYQMNRLGHVLGCDRSVLSNIRRLNRSSGY